MNEKKLSGNQFIRSKREQLGLTRKELAAACNVTEATVTTWETKGVGNVRMSRVCLIADALRVTTDEILKTV